MYVWSHQAFAPHSRFAATFASICGMPSLNWSCSGLTPGNGNCWPTSADGLVSLNSTQLSHCLLPCSSVALSDSPCPLQELPFVDRRLAVPMLQQLSTTTDLSSLFKSWFLWSCAWVFKCSWEQSSQRWPGTWTLSTPFWPSTSSGFSQSSLTPLESCWKDSLELWVFRTMSSHTTSLSKVDSCLVVLPCCASRCQHSRKFPFLVLGSHQLSAPSASSSRTSLQFRELTGMKFRSTSLRESTKLLVRRQMAKARVSNWQKNETSQIKILNREKVNPYNNEVYLRQIIIYR